MAERPAMRDSGVERDEVLRRFVDRVAGLHDATARATPSLIWDGLPRFLDLLLLELDHAAAAPEQSPGRTPARSA
jgi:hypothetical protein